MVAQEASSNAGVAQAGSSPVLNFHPLSNITAFVSFVRLHEIIRISVTIPVKMNSFFMGSVLKVIGMIFGYLMQGKKNFDMSKKKAR
jgi:hypothetical protein